MALNVVSKDIDLLLRSPSKDDADDMDSRKPSSALISPHVSNAIRFDENPTSLFQKLLEPISFASAFNSKKFIDEFAAKLLNCSTKKENLCKDKERLQCNGRTKL